MTRHAHDHAWLLAAIEESRACPMSTTAYAVGAIVVDAEGRELARGHSREDDPHVHAEESVLSKLPGADLTRATIYTSLEPCSTRKSRLRACTDLILAAGIRRVVFALREPPTFVDGVGTELLQQAGIEVHEISDLSDAVRQINNHVIGARHAHEQL
jgi:pyrimidine deaminase RibD-like protein